MAKLREIEVDDYLKDCLELEPEAINEEYARLPADYAYWNEKYAAANRASLEAEWEEEKAEAQLLLAKREEAAAAGGKTNESVIEARVKTDPKYEEAHRAAIRAQAERDYLRGVLEALRTKREMLVSTGAQLRQEIDTDPVMRDRMSRRRTERDGLGS